MAELVPTLRRFRELMITDEIACALIAMSPATMDRRLAADRAKMALRGRSHTKPGSLLKSQIPIAIRAAVPSIPAAGRCCVGQDGVVGYANTFIAVAEDCRAATGEIPPERAGGPTVASTQHAMLAAAPGRWTQDDVLLASSPQVRGHDVSETELSKLRDEFFNRPRACLRASPLPKAFGWGLHYDADGRITLHAVDSPEYAQLSIDPSLTQLRAMRSSRAAG